ncbi:hypothetical protein F4805DRAFT_472280 [Annulohypoxylon moriforme]|nr:hypothetical protein F4805DRAFT_472280 [Annulohypoxylon moriforme]
MPLQRGMRFGLPIRNNCFVGRELQLNQLQQRLVNNRVASPESQEAISCVLYSPNGWGKTEIAVEFAYRNRDFFDCIIFLKGSIEHGLEEEFQNLAKYFGIHATKSTVVGRIKESFEESKLRWLLILDGIDFELDSLVTLGEFGSIIMTTQIDTMLPLGHPITVEPLTEEMGAALMRRYLESARHGQLPPSFKDDELGEISRKFGNHPPYLLKVVNASADYESSSKILQDINGQNQIASIFRRSSTNLRINFTELPRTSLNLLLVIAFLDGFFIHHRILLSSDDLPMDIGCSDAFRMYRTIDSLWEKRLISLGQNGISIDRDLQIDILCWLDIFTTLRDAAFSSACSLIERMMPPIDALQAIGSCDPNNAVCSPIIHAIRLYENLHQTPGRKMAYSTFALTLRKSSQDFWVATSSTEGNILFKAALAVVQAFKSQGGEQNVPGSELLSDAYGQTGDPRERAESLERDISGFLGAISSENGLEQKQQSLTYRRSPLQVRLRYTNKTEQIPTVTRDTDLYLQNAYSDLSFGLLYQGNFIEADRIIEIYRSHYEKWDPSLTDLPFENAKYYLVKSFTSMASGDSEKALQLCQQAIDFLAQGHRDTWLFSHYQFVQATMYFYAGQTRKALELHETLLAEKSSRSLPQDDISHVESVYMVSTLNYFAGNYRRAVTLCENILEYGLEKHPEERARLEYILSLAYVKCGMPDDGRIMSDRAEQFRIQHMNLTPRHIYRTEEPLATHDYFCSFYTRLTSKLKSPSVGRIADIF